jgi:hypothetical protein
MLTQLHTLRLRRNLIVIPSIALAALLNGCGSMDFASVSLTYPVYPMGQTELHAITSTLTVTDKRQDRSLDHLVKTSVVRQVREQIAQDLKSTGRFMVADGAPAKYSLQVEIEQLNSEIPGYATRSAANALLSTFTMNLADFMTRGTQIVVIGHVRFRVILSESGKGVVWDSTVSGEHKETASMQSAKAHAIEGSVLTFALQEAVAKLKARVLQSPGKVSMTESARHFHRLANSSFGVPNNLPGYIQNQFWGISDIYSAS